MLKITNSRADDDRRAEGPESPDPFASIHKPYKPDRQLLPLAEVAALFGRSRRTIRWWIAEGRLPVVRVGRTPFVPAAALDRLVTDAMDVASNEPGEINEIGGNHEEG